jgi:hypothetical protein
MTIDLDNTDRVIGLLVAVCTLLGLVVGWVRWVRPKIHNGRREVVAVRDAILGRDAIADSITGREIAPAVPGIGVRMAHQEKQMELLTEAVAQIANSQLRFDNLETHVANHEERLKSLEDASVERVVTKVESAQAWRAMEEAIKAEPDETPDLD